MTSIPYTVERRPDTGVNNVMLGMWLFLASEVMLFGGLFSAYALLRAGASVWPKGALSVLEGGAITAVMLGASAAMLAAQRAAASDMRRARLWLHVTSVLAIIFLGLKAHEWSVEIGRGMYPATSTFFALYFLLTGVHAVHVLGGLVATAFVRGRKAAPAVLANRIAATALYWYFVDIVWLAIFVLMYLA